MPWTLTCPDDRVVVVAMNSSAVNAQNDGFIRDLHAAVDELEREHPRRAVVLASDGRCFSAGLDFEAVFGMFASGEVERIAAFSRRYVEALLRWFHLPQPTVAAIGGHVFAGGVVLAMACDFRVARPAVRLAVNEVPIGIPMPGAYVELIAHAIGRPAAARAMLLGEEVTGQALLDRGLVHALVADDDDVVACARRLLGGLAPDALLAYAFTKRGLQAPTLAAIREATQSLDRELPALLAAPEARRLLGARYRAIKGVPPPWEAGS